MFEHMVNNEDNELKALFEAYNLDDEKKLLIKELILGFGSLEEKYNKVRNMPLTKNMMLFTKK